MNHAEWIGEIGDYIKGLDVKAEAIRATVEGPVSSFFPASALQLHEEVTAFIDPDASRLLTMRRYYEVSRMQEKSLRDAGRL